MFQINKKATGPIEILKDGEPIKWSYIVIRNGIYKYDVQEFMLDGVNQSDIDVQLSLQYSNIQISGTLGPNLRVEHGKDHQLGLIQLMEFEAFFDGKPELKLTFNMWDEDDYRQAAE